MPTNEFPMKAVIDCLVLYSETSFQHASSPPIIHFAPIHPLYQYSTKVTLIYLLHQYKIAFCKYGIQ